MTGRKADPPPRILSRLRRVCLALPEAYEENSDGPLVVVTFRAAGMLHDVLRTTGAPFFRAAWGTRWGTKVIGAPSDRGTDWDQVAMLITESYRLLAPRSRPDPGPS